MLPSFADPDHVGVFAGQADRPHLYRRLDDLGSMCHWCLADCEAPAHWLPYEIQRIHDRLVAERCDAA